MLQPQNDVDDDPNYNGLMAFCVNARPRLVECVLEHNPIIYPEHIRAPIINGDKEIVKLLTEKAQVSVNRKIFGGWQPIHYACEEGHTDIVKLLLDHGAEINTATNNGWQAIHHAANKGHTDIVKLLLDHNAKVNATTNNGWQAIHLAAEQGHTDIVKLLLDHGAEINAATNDGWQAIHLAAEQEHTDIVKLLLDHDAEVNATRNNGWQAIHLAAEQGHTDIVKLLLDHGAEINAATNDALKVIHIATLHENPNTKKMLTFLIQEKKEDPNTTTQDDYEDPPIHIAAQFNNASAINCLLELGANIDQQNKYGLTALCKAIINEKKTVCFSLLIEKGAKIDIETSRTFYSVTPIIYALLNSKNPQTVKSLLDAGAYLHGSGRNLVLGHPYTHLLQNLCKNPEKIDMLCFFLSIIKSYNEETLPERYITFVKQHLRGCDGLEFTVIQEPNPTHFPETVLLIESQSPNFQNQEAQKLLKNLKKKDFMHL